MRYFVIFLILIGFAGTAFAQQTENDNNESDQFLPSPSIFYGLVKEPIKINLHQYAIIKDLNIQILFFKIIEDSRCPSDVTCVWQGRVSVQLNVTAENDSKQIVLSLENATAPINDDYYLMLLDVEPYPTGQSPIQEKDYAVTIQLERIGPSQSPLQQFRSGILINETQCKEEFVLVFKTSNENPACVKYGTGARLLDRGWATCLYDKISYTRGHPCGLHSGHPKSFDDYTETVIVVIPEGSANSEKQFHLIPKEITVVLGKNNTVTWINQDNTASNLVADDDTWGTGMLLPGMSSSVTFNQTGIFEYHGEPHPWKKGKVIVLGENKHDVKIDCNNIDGRTEAQCFNDSFEMCVPAVTHSVIYTIEGDALYLEGIIRDDCKIHVTFDDSGDRFGGSDKGVNNYVCNNVKLHQKYIWTIDECAGYPEFQINYEAQDWGSYQKCIDIGGMWNYTFHNCVGSFASWFSNDENQCVRSGGTPACMSYEQMGHGRDVCRHVCEFEPADRK